MYFPLQAPFHLASPPTAAISVPWNVDCGLMDISVAAVSKAKFYYLCSVWKGQNTCWRRCKVSLQKAIVSTPSCFSLCLLFLCFFQSHDIPTKRRTFRLYIFDSKTSQTQGPFTSQSYNTPIANPFVHLFPVYNASHQDEPQFLVANWLAQYNEPVDPSVQYYVPTVIDLLAPNSSSQVWPRFSLPESISVGKGLGPNCHTRRAHKKLVISSIVSGLFGVAVATVLVFRWRRTRKARTSVADDTCE